MFRSFHLRTAALVLALAGAAGCSAPKTAIYEHEHFDDSGTFSRNYPVDDAASCEAARRALLSQGYIITSSDPKLISGHKSFQQTGESHLEISFNVVCAEDGSADHRSTMFANALQDRYALKKVNNSASLGVGVLGSVSMPIGSTDDSMVKVASETVSSAKFYERFFALVELFLPAKPIETAPLSETPNPDIGVPEPSAQTLPAIVPLAVPEPELTPAPAAIALPASEPFAAPPEATPILPLETVMPEAPTDTPTEAAVPAATEATTTIEAPPADAPTETPPATTEPFHTELSQ